MGTKGQPLSETDAILLAERGAVAVTIEASMHLEADESAWRAFASALDAEVREEEGGRWSARFASFPDGIAAGNFYIAGDFHPDRKGQIHLSLHRMRAPSDSPPARLVRLHERSGGMEKFKRLFSANWPGPGEIEAEVNVSYLLNTTKWRSDLLPPRRRKKQEVARDGAEAELEFESRTWTIRSPQDIRQVTALHHGADGPMAIMIVKGRPVISPQSGDLVASAELKLWEAVSTFLSPRMR